MPVVIMFKSQFSAFVITGTKRQTVRPTRKRELVEGQEVSLRQWSGKPYRSRQLPLASARITCVRAIEIWPEKLVFPDGMHPYDKTVVTFDPTDLTNFARADGFPEWDALVQWFQREHGLPFTGELIQWELIDDEELRNAG